MLAAVSSGLSLFAISSEINSDIPLDSTGEIVSTSILDKLVPTGSKAVALTEITFIESKDLTVAIQLPA